MLPLDVLSLALLTISTAAFSRASAALVNVTIDDTFGDPNTRAQIVYDPPGVWKIGQNCTDCTAQPDRSQLANGTWHDGTFNATVENGDDSNQLLTAAVTFEGVAVYVYCVVTHSFKSPVGNSDMSFFIDGNLVGNFVQPPTGDTTYEYNVPVYANDSLPPGTHTIAIVNGVPNGNQSLTLLDYIVYTQDITSTANSPSSLTPSATAPAASTTPSPSPNAMAESASSTTSHTRTIVIATVASIGGVLFLVVVVALTIYCARRRYRPYRAPANGVIATDAAPIDEDDPGTSGWVEGTWGGDEESTTGRRSNSGKRKRGASNAQSPAPPVPSKPVLPVLPKTKSPTVPQSAMSGVPAFRILSPSQMSHSRADPAPLSPTSSFGNLTSTVPDSATYLLTPAETAAFPGPTRYTNTNAKTSDTFLDMGRSFTDADASLTSLSSHNAHPFATAQAVMPSSYGPSRQRSGRDRSDSNQSASSQATVSAALPTAPPSALSAASRGPARGPAKKPSNSDLVSPSPSTITSAAPSSYGNTAGSSVGAGRIVRSPSPSTLPSSSAATTPTSTTTLMPKRQASNAGAGATSRGPAPPRRVDPVDPAMQPPRDPEAYNREKERERERRHERDRDRERDRERQRAQLQGPRQAQPHSHPQPQSQTRGQERTQPQAQQQEEQEEQEEQQQQHAQNKGGRRQGMMMSDRDRKRFGFLDVPQDAADSRPPSYRETG